MWLICPYAILKAVKEPDVGFGLSVFEEDDKKRREDWMTSSYFLFSSCGGVIGGGFPSC